MKSNVKKITVAAVCLALAMLLPFLTGQIQQLGNALSPMHIPVLLCGFICGAPYGFIIGLISPILRFALFGMPPIFPKGIIMVFELAAYGLSAGLLYKMLPKKIPNIYVSLILSMLIGRTVAGIAKFVLVTFFAPNIPFGWAIFWTDYFVTSLPGIILHIVLIPVIVISLKKAKLIPNE